MKIFYTFLLSISFLFITKISYGQVDTIAIQDFETVPATPTLTYSVAGGQFYSGILTGGRPSSTPQYTSGSSSYGIVNGVSTLTFNSIDVSEYEDIAVSFRLASLSSTVGNGADNTDSVTIAVSINNGPWINQITVKGGTSGTSQTCWGFNDGLQIATQSYDVNNYTSLFSSYNDASNMSLGYGFVTLSGLPTVSNIRFRITLRNNAAGERWLIDDVVLTGQPASPSIIIPSRTTMDGFTYTSGVMTPVVDTFRVSGDSLVPASGFLGLKSTTNFLISTSASGPFLDTLSLAYSDSTLPWTTIYVQMAGGLSMGNYTGSIKIDGGDASPKTINLVGNVTPGPCDDLIISEYVLGTGNNKYIEIYNPTSNPILLNDGGINNYRLVYYANGSATATNIINFNTNATIPTYGTYVIGHGSGTLHTPDQTYGWAFTGDDVISLHKNMGTYFIVLDVFGEIGVDPGEEWSSGGNATRASTLVRNPDIQIGSPSQPGFPTLGTEWTSYSNNEGHNLGFHVNTCSTIPTTSVTRISNTTICPGESMTVDFSATGTFNAGNIFTAQLSGSNGLFTSPTNIGTLSSSGTNPSGTISVTIPISATASSNYHIRVVSSNPAAGALINHQHLNIYSNTPAVVTSPAHTQASGQTTLSWNNPVSGCWEDVLVVLSTNPSFTFTPTGNGSAYTPNSVYASGTQVIYRGNGNSTPITNLTDGTVYYVKIFTRNGTTWSTAVNYEFLVDRYCYPKYNNPYVCDEYISRVTINTLDNTTGENCGYNGYSWHANQSTTLVKGQTYELSVQVGIVGETNNESYLGNDIRVWFDWNGNGELVNTGGERVVNITNNGATGTYNITVPATAVTGSIRMRVQLLYEDTDYAKTSSCNQTFVYGETEDYTINIIEPCTTILPAYTFYPREGSEGTEIRIVRTSGTANFTQVDSIYINNIKVDSYRIEDDNTIYVIIPEGTGTGRIKLFDNTGCYRLSALDFLYKYKDGLCNTYTDLFISEIFDSSTHYIEIYNGTNNAIDLNTPNNYSIRVENIAPPSPTVTTTNFNIFGVIPPGENRVYYIANNPGPPKATGSQDHTSTGFNADDRVSLVKNGVAIDVFQAPSFINFNYRRLHTISGPTNTYNASEWTAHNSPHTSNDIGSYIVNPPFEITSQPIDIQGCEINFSVTATGTGLTYKWYFNNNNTNEHLFKIADSLPIVHPEVSITGFNTNNLNVSGDLAALNNYQFFCVVSNGSCTEHTKTVRFELIPYSYFRSKQSGDWRAASTWEMSPTGLPGTWEDACTFPWDTNSVAVNILNGHTVIINEIAANEPDVSIDQLVIDEGGTLDLVSTAELWIPNGTGVDMLVNGTFIDRGVSSPNGVELSTGATWQLGSNGTFIKIGNTTLDQYRTNYEGGISTIPATAHWIYRKETTITPNVLSINMYYPNLYFENTHSNNSNFTFNGLIGTSIIKGNLVLRGEFTTFVTDTNTYTQPITVLGNLQIDTLNTFRTYVLTSTVGTGIEVAGNMTINGSLILDRNNTFLKAFNGNTQSISGNGLFSVNNFYLSKALRTKLNLLRNIEVKNQLFLEGGIIQTGVDTLYVSNGLVNSISGFDIPNNTGTYSNDKYVIGNLKRRISESNSVYTFPVGENETVIGYNPSRLTIRNLPAGAPTATGKFVHSWPGTINTLRVITCIFNDVPSDHLIEYKGLTNQGYWQFDGSTFVNYDINIHPNILNVNTLPNEDSPLGHRKNYRALKEQNFKAGTVWDPEVSILGNRCIVSWDYHDIIGSGYTGFSIFAPGGGDGNTTALPIELLSFDIECQSQPVLRWATASETNTDYFTIERSNDGIHFEAYASISAAGYSSQKIDYSYTITDQNPYEYYRLVETDLDGSVYYHGIRHLDCISEGNDHLFVYYQDNQGIVVNNNFGKSIKSIRVFDAAGRLMTDETIHFGESQHVISSARNYAKGMYFVNVIYSNGDIKTEKVILQ